jgi:Mg2+-importing ATPase
VDESQTQRAGKWNLKMIRKYMVVFGLHSSVFDMITFFLMYHLYKLQQGAFQTSWFLESVFTELLILFVMRTRLPFFSSKPGKLLLWVNVSAAIITLWLPFSPFSELLGFAAPQVVPLLSIFVILIVYLVTADWLKMWFFKREAI